MTIKRLMDLKVDIAFKNFFSDEELLVSFLNSLLGEGLEGNIKSVISITGEQLPEFEDDKLSILDILVKTDKGHLINIEVQIVNKYNIVKRMLYYWSRIYSNQIRKGGSYLLLKKTISICILNYDLEENQTSAYRTVYGLKELTHNFKLTDTMEIHFIEVQKFREHMHKHGVKVRYEMDKWLLFLAAVNKEDKDEALFRKIEEMTRGDQIMQKAFDAWNNISFKNDDNWGKYLQREKAAYDSTSKDDIYKDKMISIKKMLQKGMTDEEIMDLLNLEEDIYLELKNLIK